MTASSSWRRLRGRRWKAAPRTPSVSDQNEMWTLRACSSSTTMRSCDEGSGSSSRPRRLVVTGERGRPRRPLARIPATCPRRRARRAPARRQRDRGLREIRSRHPDVSCLILTSYGRRRGPLQRSWPAPRVRLKQVVAPTWWTPCAGGGGQSLLTQRHRQGAGAPAQPQAPADGSRLTEQERPDPRSHRRGLTNRQIGERSTWPRRR